jgi:hypothetical protein
MANIAETKKTNRRTSPRRKPRGFVKLECRKGSMGLGFNLANVLLDVSETGARLVVNHELTTSQEVEVVFSGYGLSGPIKRLANLRWLLKLDDGKFCIGVEFQKRLDFRDLQSIVAPMYL